MVRGLERLSEAVVVHFDQEKPVFGDTCSRLLYTKQEVASLNTNIYNGESRLLGPGGSSLAWPGASPAQARFWKSGNLEIQKFGVQQISKMEILKIQISSAHNVGKVWTSWKKNLPAPFGATPGNFLHGPKKSKKILNFCLFSLVGQWALFTRFGVMCWCHWSFRILDLWVFGHRS